MKTNNEEHAVLFRGTLMRYARLGALLLFAVITVYGIYLLFRGNWQEVTGYWLARRRLLILCFLLSACDILTDAFIWTMILRKLGVHTGRRGVLIFLCGYAGHLMPVQLGRFFRASEVNRLNYGDMATAVKAEIILLYFVVVTSIAVFCGALLFHWSAIAAILVPAALIVTAMLITNMLFSLMPLLPVRLRFSVRLPDNFWRQPGTITLAFMAALGWLLNGTILYLIFRDVAEGLLLNQTIMIMTSNLFVGVASGLPGGLGLTESYIGAIMYWLQTPPEHLVMAVAAFRIITFWIWIPIGWTALLLVSMVVPRKPPCQQRRAPDKKEAEGA